MAWKGFKCIVVILRTCFFLNAVKMIIYIYIYIYIYREREREREAHVLLNLLNELGKRDKMQGLPSI